MQKVDKSVEWDNMVLNKFSKEVIGNLKQERIEGKNHEFTI